MADEADTLPGEVWKDVPGSKNYEVSSLGRVRVKARLLKPWKHRAGYSYINTGSKRWSLHRLVCWAFYGPPNHDKIVAAHNDGCPDNNTLENLRWATYSENSADAARHGTAFDIAAYAARLPKEKKPNRRLSAKDCKQIVEKRNNGVPRAEVAACYKISQTHVSRICSGEFKKRYGG